MRLRASAPGSFMLLGEYAVLYGKQALVCAVDKRITVDLAARNDDIIEIYSSLHGHYQTQLSQLKIEKPFQFVLAALKQYQAKLRRGFDIKIESEFSDKVGLGSSAAVTVATLATLVTWLNMRMSPVDLLRQARNVIREVQGMGSGADVAASVYGGLVNYQAHPLSAEKLTTTFPFVALYAGFKTPTVDAIKHVHNYFSTHPNLFRAISNSIGQCAAEGIQVARKEDWSKLGEIMNIQQGMMESLGVCTPVLRDMVEDLRKQPGIKGAKISGSGLGDCVIGIGEVSTDYSYVGNHSGIQHIPVTMTSQGVFCEKI